MEMVPPDRGPSADSELSGAAEELDWRLAGMEGRLDAISERVERLEASVREAVGEEVRAATSDLRRAISELGRRLVQDLPHELARHRDAIVAELRPPPAPEPPPAPPSPDPALDLEPEPDDTEEPAPAAVAATATPESAERRRPSRLRRRHG